MNAIAAYTLSPWHILLLAIVLLGASFAVQGRQGINLADEGFLWYGAQQTAHGKVPLRDFQSYDPGRYYWSAAGMRLFGEGLVALRFSETIFQLLGLWAGLLAASRVVQNWALLAGVGLMLTLWMFPSHKLFDITLLLCGIWIAVRLIEEPSPDSNFHGRFFCRPVRLFRQKSRTLQFSRTSVSVALPSFQTGPTAVDIASRNVGCRYHGWPCADDRDVRRCAWVFCKLHRVHSVDFSPWNQSPITGSVALAGFAKFRPPAQLNSFLEFFLSRFRSVTSQQSSSLYPCDRKRSRIMRF